MIDGVYQIAPRGALFHPVPAPTDADVAGGGEQVYPAGARGVDARGDDGGARAAAAEPALATPAGASGGAPTCIASAPP